MVVPFFIYKIGEKNSNLFFYVWYKKKLQKVDIIDFSTKKWYNIIMYHLHLH